MASDLQQWKRRRSEQIRYTRSYPDIRKSLCVEEFSDLETFRRAICALHRSNLSPYGSSLVRAVVKLYVAIAEDYSLLAVYGNLCEPIVSASYCTMFIYGDIYKNVCSDHFKTCETFLDESRSSNYVHLHGFIVRMELDWCCQLLNNLLCNLGKSKSYVLEASHIQCPQENKLFFHNHDLYPDEFPIILKKQLPSLLWDYHKLWISQDTAVIESHLSLPCCDEEDEQAKKMLPGGLKLATLSTTLLEYSCDCRMVTLVTAIIGDYLSNIDKACGKNHFRRDQDMYYFVIATISFIHEQLSVLFTRLKDATLKSNTLSLLLKAAKICDDAVGTITSQKVATFVCYLSHDPESNDWKNPGLFYEGERCSFSIQMLNYQICGFMHDLQIYVPGRVAAKMISMVMNDVYTFLFNRYSSTCPTLRRTKQFSADICLALSMAAMFLPYLAPLRYGRGHSLAVYLDHIHYSCTQLLSLLAIVSCPLQSLYTMLAASDHDNMPSWEMWLHHITELFQDSVLKSHHVPVCGQYFNSDNLLHCALALDVSSLEIVQLLLSNDCYISKLLVCAINIQQQIADAVLGILEACWNCPSALSVVFQHHLKTRQSRAEFSLSTIMENTVIGSWILAHFQEITHLALHYGEAAYYLIQSDRDQSKTKESNYANAFTKEVKECIKSFHLPFVLALRKLCEQCSCTVNEVVIYAVSRGLDTKVHFLEPIVKDVFTSFFSNILSSLKTEMLMRDDFKPSFPEGQTKWDYANCVICSPVGDELKKACGHHMDLIARVLKENIDPIREAVHKNLLEDYSLELTMPSLDSKLFNPVVSSQRLAYHWSLDFEVIMSMADQVKGHDLMQYVLSTVSRAEIVKWIKQRFEFQENAVLSDSCLSVVKEINSLL